MNILRERNVDVHVLPPWNDVDEYEDLESFYAAGSHLPPGTLHTIDFLHACFGRLP